MQPNRIRVAIQAAIQTMSTKTVEQDAAEVLALSEAWGDLLGLYSQAWIYRGWTNPKVAMDAAQWANAPMAAIEGLQATNRIANDLPPLEIARLHSTGQLTLPPVKQ